MITEQALHEAIAECQGQRNPNSATCIKLASFYTILDHMNGKANSPVSVPQYSYDEPPEVEYVSETDFSKEVQKIDRYDVMKTMDELMETLRTMYPKLYDAVMRKLATYE